MEVKTLLSFTTPIIILLAICVWLQSNKLDRLKEDNARLEQELSLAISYNKELVDNIENLTKEYEEKFIILQEATTKKDEVAKEINIIRKGIKDENDSAIITARDILSRMLSKSNN